MKSELVVNASLSMCKSMAEGWRVDVERDLPADTMFLQFPLGYLASVEYTAYVEDVFFEFFGNLPLRVVCFSRRHRDKTSRENLFGVSKNLLAPPFELSIFSWRQTANEWSW